MTDTTTTRTITLTDRAEYDPEPAYVVEAWHASGSARTSGYRSAAMPERYPTGILYRSEMAARDAQDRATPGTTRIVRLVLYADGRISSRHSVRNRGTSVLSW